VLRRGKYCPCLISANPLSLRVLCFVERLSCGRRRTLGVTWCQSNMARAMAAVDRDLIMESQPALKCDSALQNTHFIKSSPSEARTGRLILGPLNA